MHSISKPSYAGRCSSHWRVAYRGLCSISSDSRSGTRERTYRHCLFCSRFGSYFQLRSHIRCFVLIFIRRRWFARRQSNSKNSTLFCGTIARFVRPWSWVIYRWPSCPFFVVSFSPSFNVSVSSSVIRIVSNYISLEVHPPVVFKTREQLETLDFVLCYNLQGLLPPWDIAVSLPVGNVDNYYSHSFITQLASFQKAKAVSRNMLCHGNYLVDVLLAEMKLLSTNSVCLW